MNYRMIIKKIKNKREKKIMNNVKVVKMYLFYNTWYTSYSRGKNNGRYFS